MSSLERMILKIAMKLKLKLIRKGKQRDDETANERKIKRDKVNT